MFLSYHIYVRSGRQLNFLEICRVAPVVRRRTTLIKDQNMPFLHHDNQIPLEPTAILWRYISREKLESLLKDRALFFCRADKFTDPFEGSIPKREADYRPKEAMRRQTAFQRPIDGKMVEDNIAGISSLHRRFKSATVVNCWQINLNESDAMWRLYLKDNEGVAIQTTAAKMMAAIQSCPE